MWRPYDYSDVLNIAPFPLILNQVFLTKRIRLLFNVCIGRVFIDKSLRAEGAVLGLGSCVVDCHCSEGKLI